MKSSLSNPLFDPKNLVNINGTNYFFGAESVFNWVTPIGRAEFTAEMTPGRGFILDRNFTRTTNVGTTLNRLTKIMILE
ncbi:hypothetical protein B566_EDAN016839 [Ephemera danica]|nr:hypothetical protein B566_EDAN016839 [Ephemera danica]